jgi:hypothetical protein|tara:strand:+ start:498 stop:776 length:279 start_codon:yes stop_codon:yes gene_type:complete
LLHQKDKNLFLDDSYVLITGGIMRRIMKLTPSTIKRLIAEEREKLQQEKKVILLEQLRLLKKIKNRQIKSLKEVKELNEVKNTLITFIKGKK